MSKTNTEQKSTFGTINPFGFGSWVNQPVNQSTTFPVTNNNPFQSVQTGQNTFQPVQTGQNTFQPVQTGQNTFQPNWPNNQSTNSNNGWSPPLSNNTSYNSNQSQQPLSNLQSYVQPVQIPSYKISFVNESDDVKIALSNIRQHKVMVNLVGKGTKFDIAIPVDQEMEIVVTVIPSKISNQNIYEIASVDNNPFRL
jgi:hypothetical protein